jgi:protein-tyrosine phosphatase|nr:CpsB/CapC family capsule biosynthesis tyrosine phosphatase [Kofleriaceae bacterium]
MGFVDLHSHVLFGLDDGSPDLATSLAMLDGLGALGVTEQCVTPHQKAAQFLPSFERIDAAFAAVDAARTANHPTLRLAAENMWDDVFFERLAHDQIPPYARSKAFLVEIPPPLMPPNLRDRLFTLRMAGRVPVLAHPERYHAMWDDDALATEIRRCAVFAIDLPALAGFHGKREAKQARHLVEIGLAGAVATDSHNLGDIQQSQQGLQWLAKKLGSSAVDRLFGDAPRAILAGDFVE